MGHAEISISSRVFPLRLEIMRIALNSDSQCPPPSFTAFFPLTDMWGTKILGLRRSCLKLIDRIKVYNIYLEVM